MRNGHTMDVSDMSPVAASPFPVPPHRRFLVEDPSQVGEVRRTAQVLAIEQGLGEVAAGRLALVVTELGTNLVRHAGGGAVLLGAPAPGVVEVLSLDRGPGMDLERCLLDGYSTGGSAGQGLGAVQRASEHFGAFSRLGDGCVIAARICQDRKYTFPSSSFDIGALELCAPGEHVCGDAWAWRDDGMGDEIGAILLADGLGHGPQAAEAALSAVECFRRAQLSAGPLTVLGASHEPLRRTRLDVQCEHLRQATEFSVCSNSFQACSKPTPGVKLQVADPDIAGRHLASASRCRPPESSLAIPGTESARRQANNGKG